MNQPDRVTAPRLQRFQYARIAGALLLLAAGAACATPHAESQKPSPPAKVENAVKETDLATVTLSPEAESRLGIQTAAVAYTRVTATRTYGAEVVLPPDSTMTVSAPVAGTILNTSDVVPQAGMNVKKGQAVFRLLPLLPPERDARSQSEKELTDAETRVAAARVRLERAEQLLRDKAGSVRQVEQTREELQLAESALKAARERSERVRRAPLEGDVSISITSPEDGMIQKIHAGAGQRVAGSAALFEIASLARIWVRVPVYVGDLGSIDRRQPAQIHNLDDSPGATMLTARPIAAPPSANPNAATVDLYFQLPNGASLRPGQKVGVTLMSSGAEDALVVPNSAIIRDIHGGEWVYAKPAPQQYARRRVEVRNINGSQAVLARGPSAGTQVVITGAAELFATEFSTGK